MPFESQRNGRKSLSNPLGPPHTTSCAWNFGNVLPNTTQDFGKDAQYGTPNVARYAGTIISAPMPNPQFTGRCANQQ